MKKYLVTAFLVFLMLWSGVVFGQFRAENLGGGAQFGGTVGDTEFGRDTDIGMNFRVYLRHSLTSALEAELNTSIAAKMRDDNYATNLNPIELRLLLRPYTSEYWSPYFYAGVGALHYDIKTYPAAPNVTAGVEDAGWTGHVPFGLGLQFKVGNNSSLEFSGGNN